MNGFWIRVFCNTFVDKLQCCNILPLLVLKTHSASFNSFFSTCINKIIARNSITAAAVLLATALTPPLAQAEGSKNLTPGTGTRGTATGANNYIGYLQHDDGGNSRISTATNGFLKPGSDPLERLYIHLGAGETLYYGVRRIATNGTASNRLRLEVKYATTTVITASSTILEPNTASPQSATLLPARGVIATPEEAAIGPKYVDVSGTATAPAGGYNPLAYTNATGAAQDVWVEFTQVNAAGTPVVIKSWYDCWDFTVRSATGEKPGRLYSSAWSFTGAEFNNQFSTEFALYPLIPNPNFNNTNFFVKKVSYSRIKPFGVLLTANEFGTDVAGDYVAKRKSQTSSTVSRGYAQYKLFVNDPDGAVYQSTTPPNAPTITTTCSGTGTNKSTTFSLAIDQAGFGIVFIDGNNNQTYEATADRVLERQTTISNTANTFVWDGNSDTGVRIPAGPINLVFSSGVGPVNFPMYDCEAADAAGITVRSVRPGNNNGFIDFLFYDDTNIGGNFSTPIRNPIGNNSATGSHKWGANGSGDMLTVNTYAVGLLAQGRVLSFAYDGSGCVLTAPVVLITPLPVELIRFGALLQPAGVRVSWETATERNNAYFDVERSADGRAFEAVARVAGNGTSSQQHSYATLDPAPLGGVSFYRLRQVDTDGRTSFSPVVAVENTARNGATLYPNPATTEVNLRFAEALRGPVDIRVMDAAGRVVWQERREATAGERELRIPTAQLPATGLYMVQVRRGTTSQVYRFSK